MKPTSTRIYQRPAQRAPRQVLMAPQQETNAVSEQSQSVKRVHSNDAWRRRVPRTTDRLLQYHIAKARRAHPNLNVRGLGELPESLLQERKDQHERILDPSAGFYDDWENLYTASNFPFIVGIVSTQIIPANPRRTFLMIQNKSVGSFYVNYGQGANAFVGIKIGPGGSLTFDGGERGGSMAPADSINVVSPAADSRGVLTEGVKLSVGPATE